MQHSLPCVHTYTRTKIALSTGQERSERKTCFEVFPPTNRPVTAEELLLTHIRPHPLKPHVILVPTLACRVYVCCLATIACLQQQQQQHDTPQRHACEGTGREPPPNQRFQPQPNGLPMHMCLPNALHGITRVSLNVSRAVPNNFLPCAFAPARRGCLSPTSTI